ncbi:MAG: hypothetical protein R3E76_06170 [Planctomycetota bacterium]
MQHPEDHDITALAYDLIEGAEREALLEHLSECDACRALYDNYRDEQSVVREAIVRDARSGAAEAKALENTLKMLGAIAPTEDTDIAENKRGRLLHMPVWVIAGQVAALLAVAAGLFFIMKPAPVEAPADDAITVAEIDRAPASVDEGVVYVRDTEGDWKQADAMPMDEWVMAGDSKVLTFTMANGSKAELQPNAVFRIARNGGNGDPIVYLLHGNGVIDTRNVAGEIEVQAGEANFLTMPGARVQLECLGEADRESPRSWSRATYVGAQVLDGEVGDVVVTSNQRGLPLQNGERVEWTPQKFEVIEIDGETFVFGHTYEFVPDGETEDGSVPDFEAMRKQTERLRVRFEALEKRMQKNGGENNRLQIELEKTMREMLKDMPEWRFTPAPPQELEGFGPIHDVLVLADEAGTMFVTSNGKMLSVRITDRTGAVTYEATSLEALLEKMPENHRERLAELEVKKDDDGNLRIVGGDSTDFEENHNGMKVKIVRQSNESKRD